MQGGREGETSQYICMIDRRQDSFLFYYIYLRKLKANSQQGVLSLCKAH